MILTNVKDKMPIEDIDVICQLDNGHFAICQYSRLGSSYAWWFKTPDEDEIGTFVFRDVDEFEMCVEKWADIEVTETKEK